ncbi:MAG: flagellin lysine-N-methylase [Veillonellales bacterium]
MAKMRTILQPQYVAKFRCIGPACEDSCCIGWQVPIDKTTYQKYRKCADEKLRSQMDDKVTRNRGANMADDNYAKVKLNDDNSCPFIDSDRLCAIQRQLGEEWLSLTCATYPRITNKVNGTLERSMTLSCPEAARLALLTTGLMEFDQLEESDSIRYNPEKNIDTDDIKLAAKPQRYLWELRIFIITLLQNRVYPLWQRLVVLGLFCNQLTELVGNGKVHDIPMLIGTYLNRLEQGDILSNMEAIPEKQTIQMELLKELADERFATGIISPRFLAYFAEFLQGIQYMEAAGKAEIGVRYAEAYERYYQPFMEQHEYILENYLVNYVFKNLFPFEGEKHIFDNFMLLVVHYAMIKMMLIGMSGFHKDKFGMDQVLNLIQSFVKVVEHSPSYLKKVCDLLKANQMNTLPYMTILIKN